MYKINFKLSLDKDARNMWELCNFSLPWEEPSEKKSLGEKYKKIWKGRDFEDCQEEIKKSINPLYSQGLMKNFKESLEKSWEFVNERYFERISKIMKRPLSSNIFEGYITSAGRCPYHALDNSFLVSIKRPLLQAMRTCGHEVLHINFENNFGKDIIEKIGKNKFMDLNESLTVLLNEEFKDLWFVDDKGYEPHKELREFISQEWKKEKDFDVLMGKCVDYLK